MADQNLSAQKSSYPTVLVFLTPDDAGKRVVDYAFKLTEKRPDQILAIYPGDSLFGPHMDESLRYAHSLGIETQLMAGSDQTDTLIEFIRSNRIRTLVIPRMARKKGFGRFVPALQEVLAKELPDLTLIVLPNTPPVDLPQQKRPWSHLQSFWWNLTKVSIILIAVSFLCVLFDQNGANDGVIAPFYTLAVVLVAVCTPTWRWPAFSAFASILLFNYFFAYPRMNFAYAHRDLTVVYVITLITSLISGGIAQKLHTQTLKTKKAIWRTQTLLDCNRLLQETNEVSKIIPSLCHRLAKLTGRNLVFFPYSDEVLLDPQIYYTPADKPASMHSVYSARDAAQYALDHNIPSGSGHEFFVSCPFSFFPWRTSQHTFGVIGLQASRIPIDAQERSVIQAILAEAATALDYRINEQKVQSMKQEASDAALRSNMLKALSHDIRTPLTAIIGNIASLQDHTPEGCEQTAQTLEELRTDSLDLLNMVENLMTSARLENNSLPLHQTPELLEDVVRASLEQPLQYCTTHPITLNIVDDMLLCSMDAALIQQVISNMIMNAIHHTPSGTPIEVRARQENGQAIVEVCDQGPGISDKMKPQIFDLFYAGEARTFDSSHFLGLGLYLCKTIIDAHHGTIAVRNNTPKGAIFSFSLPLHALA